MRAIIQFVNSYANKTLNTTVTQISDCVYYTLYRASFVPLEHFGFRGHPIFDVSFRPTVQFSNLVDFYVYLTLISLSKINLYHRFKLWSRSARIRDDLQI